MGIQDAPSDWLEGDEARPSARAAELNCHDALLHEPDDHTATVLFADLRSFTALVEDRSPRDVMGLVKSCFRALIECVRVEGGTLHKFLGDGFMAVFGIGSAQADHATRAVRAAQAMQRAMVALVPELHAHGWDGISLGVGMETGRVVAGHVGGPDLCEYTVLGDVVNVASRLTAGAGGGEVVLGPGAAAAVCASHQLVALGEISIRGRRQPVGAWRLRSP